jgi:prevent-host-death family protein
MKSKMVSATEFKAKCLAILDQMENEGGAITITKRGRPVAILGPVRKDAWKSPKGVWANKLRIQGDLANIDTSDLWDVVRK